MGQFLSVTETAKLLGISRAAVLKKIKSGALHAEKIGHTYVIDRSELTNISEREISAQQKVTIDESVEKTIHDYGETLRLLKDS